VRGKVKNCVLLGEAKCGEAEFSRYFIIVICLQASISYHG